MEGSPDFFLTDSLAHQLHGPCAAHAYSYQGLPHRPSSKDTVGNRPSTKPEQRVFNRLCSGSLGAKLRQARNRPFRRSKLCHTAASPARAMRWQLLQHSLALRDPSGDHWGLRLEGKQGFLQAFCFQEELPGHEHNTRHPCGSTVEDDFCE